MHVILSEKEYLRLKYQSDEDKKIYVKRVDVAMALQELEEELRGMFTSSWGGGIQENYVSPQWIKAFKDFVEKVN